MLIIINGTDIEYTKDDTFELYVTTKNGFNDGTNLKFIISENENVTPLIENQTNVLDGKFKVTLNAEEKAKLNLGDYIYKLVLISTDGKIITQKSGNFLVKWGA